MFISAREDSSAAPYYQMRTYRTSKPVQKLITGYRSVVRAREGRMLGMRQPLDGPIFETLEDARNWCIHAMISHYDRRLGMSDATIEPFKGLVDCGGSAVKSRPASGR